MNQLIIELGNSLEKGQTHLVALHRTDEDELLLTIQLANPDDAKVTIPPVQFQGTVEEIATQADEGVMGFTLSAKRAINDANTALAQIQHESEAALKAARESAATRTKHVPPAKLGKLALTVTPDTATTTLTERVSKATQTSKGSTTIEKLPLGTYDLVTTADGYDSLTAVVVLTKEGDTVAHTATLVPATPSLFA